MKVFICLAIIIAIILLIRIRVHVYYNAYGFKAMLKILFFKIELPPEKKTDTEKKSEPKTKGGSLSELTDVITVGLEMLGRALSSIRIDLLNAEVIIASDDAFKTAMMYGSAAAGCGIMIPILENNFKIRKKEIIVNADFEEKETTISFTAKVSVAIWQILRLAIAFTLQFIKLKNKKKGMETNG